MCSLMARSVAQNDFIYLTDRQSLSLPSTAPGEDIEIKKGKL